MRTSFIRKLLPKPLLRWQGLQQMPLRVGLVTRVIGAVILIYVIIYIVWFTPVPVYALDKLNLRPFFLPNIVCDRCNNFSYRFTVNNRNFCSSAGWTANVDESAKLAEVEKENDDDIFLLILVATYHPNMNARRAIRSSWGNVTMYRGKRVKTLFMFGVHEDKNYNYQVRYELEHFGDVIQGDFADNYRTLTNKTMMGLKWVNRFCPRARYVLKTDDDAFNVPQRFIDYLLNVPQLTKFVGGYCFTVMPDRRESSKFYTPYTMYPDQYYPTYCSGPGYVLSRAAISDIISVAPSVSYLTMEDVFISGLCRVAAGIAYTQIPGVAEDQTMMTRCNLVTWVKNGHNIYPLAVPPLWDRVVTSSRQKDCAAYDLGLFVLLFFFGGGWIVFMWRLFAHGTLVRL